MNNAQQKPVRTLVAYVPSCSKCLLKLNNETTLRSWNIGCPIDVFKGKATFVACDEHQGNLDEILSTMSA